MHVIIDLPVGLLPKQRGLAIAFKAMVESVGQINMLLLRRGNYPLLYASGVKWQQEPLAGKGVENIATAIACLKRGWGDCDDLVAWRIAELRLRGVDATAKVYWRTKTKTYHVEVRLPDGKTEDVSRLVGML